MQEILTKEALKKKKRRKEDTKILNQLIVRQIDSQIDR